MSNNYSKTAPVRSKEELDVVRHSGIITATALEKTLNSITDGISLLELDAIAEREIIRLGGGSSFKSVPGYCWTTCLTVNDEVVHGIPRDIKLAAGDLVSVDVGAVYKGWHTDAAWSKTVGRLTKEKEKFLAVGEKALWAGIEKAVDGNMVGDISHAIQTIIEGAGLSIVRSLVGHGVGREPHEEPEIPGFGTPGSGALLKSGQVLAVEVIYTGGSGEVYQKKDGWTIASSDNSLGGLFEMSVIVAKDQPEVITNWIS